MSAWRVAKHCLQSMPLSSARSLRLKIDVLAKLIPLKQPLTLGAAPSSSFEQHIACWHAGCCVCCQLGTLEGEEPRPLHWRLHAAVAVHEQGERAAAARPRGALPPGPVLPPVQPPAQRRPCGAHSNCAVLGTGTSEIGCRYCSVSVSTY